MTEPGPASAVAVVREHVDAFNAHSTERLLAGFAPDAVWVTGTDVTHGRDGLADLFDDWLWGLRPSLAVITLVAADRHVAAELVEELTVDDERRAMNIAVFFVVDQGRITSAKVYREGSADVD
jgi:uncharacterized protein